jgi:ribosomal protein S26
MKCSLCGKTFDEEAARKTCGACALVGGCHLVRCPHCGYEMPEETRLVKAIRRWRARRRDRAQA